MKPKTSIPVYHLEVLAEIGFRSMENSKLSAVRVVEKGSHRERTILCFIDETATGHTFRPVAEFFDDIDEAVNRFYKPVDDPTEDEGDDPFSNPNLN